MAFLISKNPCQVYKKIRLYDHQSYARWCIEVRGTGEDDLVVNKWDRKPGKKTGNGNKCVGGYRVQQDNVFAKIR